MNDGPQELLYREHFVDLIEALHEKECSHAANLASIRRLIGSWSWIIDGRGSYSWDDEDYQKEFGYCLEAVNAHIEELLRLSFSRNHEVCCGKYRLMSPVEDKMPVQRRFSFGCTTEQRKEDILKAATLMIALAPQKNESDNNPA